MELTIVHTQDAALSGSIQAQFVAVKGRQVWKMAVGQTPGAYAAASEISSISETLTEAITVDAVLNEYHIPVPDGMRAAGQPRFVQLNIYDAGNTSAVALGMIADLVKGEVFNPFLVRPLMPPGETLAEAM